MKLVCEVKSRLLNLTGKFFEGARKVQNIQLCDINIFRAKMPNHLINKFHLIISEEFLKYGIIFL